MIFDFISREKPADTGVSVGRLETLTVKVFQPWRLEIALTASFEPTRVACEPMKESMCLRIIPTRAFINHSQSVTRYKSADRVFCDSRKNFKQR